MDDPARFVRTHTACRALPLVPEIRLHLAADVVDLWERMPRSAGAADVAVPFWACAWPGGVALARYLLDHPRAVAGRAVADVATGSGVAAIAAALAGAAAVSAYDVDPYALAAVGCNAAANGVEVGAARGDGFALVGVRGGAGVAGGAATARGGAVAVVRDHDVVLLGDAFYDAQIAARAWPCVVRAHAAGARVLIGDPGRAHLPRARLLPVASYDVPGTAAFEAAAVTPTQVWTPV